MGVRASTTTDRPASSRFDRGIAALGLGLVAGLVAACESAPLDGRLAEAVAPGAGPAVRVQLVDRHFVRIDAGERVPIEEMLYLMRQRGRAAALAGESAPHIILELPTDAGDVPAPVVDNMIRGLQSAGIRHIEMREVSS